MQAVYDTLNALREGVPPRELKNRLPTRGTEGSNPSPSSKESANFRSLNGGRIGVHGTGRSKSVAKLAPAARPDVARAGGMTEIRRIAALTSAHGERLVPHAWGSGVLFAASIHVAMAAPNCHIVEVTQGYMPMMWDLFNEPFDIRPDGMVHAPGRAGLGLPCARMRWSASRYVDRPEFEF